MNLFITALQRVAVERVGMFKTNEAANVSQRRSKNREVTSVAVAPHQFLMHGRHEFAPAPKQGTVGPEKYLTVIQRSAYFFGSANDRHDTGRRTGFTNRFGFRTGYGDCLPVQLF